MPNRTGLSLHQVQRLALTPGMRHRLAVLRLSAADLTEMLTREAAENPLLRFDPPSTLAPIAIAPDEDHLAAPVSLTAHLMTQIGLLRVVPEMRQAAEVVIWSLNDEGYLDLPLEEIAHDTALPQGNLDQALELVQSCDPAGVGARDLVECLTLQLHARGHDPDMVAIALPLLDQLAAGKPAILSGRPEREKAALGAIARDIPALDPQPGARFRPDPVLSLPDLILRLDGGRWQLDPAYRLADALHLDTDALDAARDDPDATAFLIPHRDRVRELIRAITDRETTLLRTARALVAHQIGLFTDGPSALRPLTRRELAEDLGLHPATLSRALAGKTLAHARGVMPLEALFSTRISGADGAVYSAVQVQTRLRRMIVEEPADAPLSDAALAAKLAEEEIDIARRTVAKYRGCLSIPPSHIRKRLRARTGLRGSAPVSGPFPSRRS